MTMMRINGLVGAASGPAKKVRDDVSGVSGIETAFILPVMLIIYLGLLDLTTVLSASRRVTEMASTLADLVTQSTGTTNKAQLQGFYRAATAIMDPFSTTDLTLEVF